MKYGKTLEDFKVMFAPGNTRDEKVRQKVIDYILKNTQASSLVYACLPAAYWADYLMLVSRTDKTTKAIGWEDDKEVFQEAMANRPASADFFDTRLDARSIRRLVSMQLEDGLEKLNCGWFDFTGPLWSGTMLSMLKALPSVIDEKEPRVPFCFSWMVGRDPFMPAEAKADPVGARVRFVNDWLNKASPSWAYELNEGISYRGVGRRVHILNVTGSFVRK